MNAEEDIALKKEKLRNGIWHILELKNVAIFPLPDYSDDLAGKMPALQTELDDEC